MKALKFFITVIALLMQCTLFAQKETLPILRSNITVADIRDDEVLKKGYWRILPDLKLDVYQTTGKKVTFYTDIDSISFHINPKVGKYDFIIVLNEKDTARTRIEYNASGLEKLLTYYTNSFDLFTIIPTHQPENFNVRTINQSFRHSASFLIHFGLSDFSLGIGLGISFHNYYMKENPNADFKKNKMTLTYLDIPVELKYRSEKGLKVSIGAKVDFLVNSYLKQKGADASFGSKVKIYNVEDLSKVQFGPIVRVGWQRLHIFGAYSFLPVYNADAGSKLNPICVGISVTPK